MASAVEELKQLKEEYERRHKEYHKSEKEVCPVCGFCPVCKREATPVVDWRQQLQQLPPIPQPNGPRYAITHDGITHN